MPSLVLYPGDPYWHPENIAALRAILQQEGLLSAKCTPDTSTACPAGEQFLQLIMFLGCSPQVALTTDDAPTDTPPCAICFNEFDAVRFVASRHRPAPRCPHCRTAATIDATAVDECVICTGCGKSTPMQNLDWRQSAGFGRFFIEVSGVYPHEAVPADHLLARLREFSQCEWKHFYKD